MWLFLSKVSAIKCLLTQLMKMFSLIPGRGARPAEVDLCFVYENAVKSTCFVTHCIAQPKPTILYVFCILTHSVYKKYSPTFLVLSMIYCFKTLNHTDQYKNTNYIHVSYLFFCWCTQPPWWCSLNHFLVSDSPQLMFVSLLQTHSSL